MVEAHCASPGGQQTPSKEGIYQQVTVRKGPSYIIAISMSGWAQSQCPETTLLLKQLHSGHQYQNLFGPTLK